MAEPLIERIKTEVYFTDANGVEWQVFDASRRRGQRWWREHAGSEWAERRYFVRYTPAEGANARRAIEVRRYDFALEESRWFVARAWQLQLEHAGVRAPLPDSR